MAPASVPSPPSWFIFLYNTFQCLTFYVFYLFTLFIDFFPLSLYTQECEFHEGRFVYSLLNKLNANTVPGTH